MPCSSSKILAFFYATLALTMAACVPPNTLVEPFGERPDFSDSLVVGDRGTVLHSIAYGTNAERGQTLFSSADSGCILLSFIPFDRNLRMVRFDKQLHPIMERSDTIAYEFGEFNRLLYNGNSVSVLFRRPDRGANSSLFVLGTFDLESARRPTYDTLLNTQLRTPLGSSQYESRIAADSSHIILFSKSLQIDGPMDTMLFNASLFNRAGKRLAEREYKVVRETYMDETHVTGLFQVTADTDGSMIILSMRPPDRVRAVRYDMVRGTNDTLEISVPMTRIDNDSGLYDPQVAGFGGTPNAIFRSPTGGRFQVYTHHGRPGRGRNDIVLLEFDFRTHTSKQTIDCSNFPDSTLQMLGLRYYNHFHGWWTVEHPRRTVMLFSMTFPEQRISRGVLISDVVASSMLVIAFDSTGNLLWHATSPRRDQLLSAEHPNATLAGYDPDLALSPVPWFRGDTLELLYHDATNYGLLRSSINLRDGTVGKLERLFWLKPHSWVNYSGLRRLPNGRAFLVTPQTRMFDLLRTFDPQLSIVRIP